MFRNNATITDSKNIAKFKRAILIGGELGVYSRLMLNKTEGKESLKKKERNVLYQSILFQKTTRKSSRVIVRDHSGQCPVQYLRNIAPAMEQSDWLILVIGPLN